MRCFYKASGLILCALSVLLLFAPLSARAATVTIGYQLAIVEDSGVIADLNNPNKQLLAANKTALELSSGRDAPYFQLDNNSPTASITKLTISLGKLPYNFDVLKSITGGSSGITFTSNIDAVEGGLRSDSITINFTGFTPGKKFRFQTNIDNDAGNTNSFVDYRSILFDTLANSSTNAASFKVDFTDPAIVGPISNTLQLPDYPTPPSSNSSSIAFSTSPTSSIQVAYAEGFNCFIPVFLTGDPSERVIPYQRQIQQIIQQTIPEPSSVILCAMLGAAMISYRSLRKRTAKS